MTANDSDVAGKILPASLGSKGRPPHWVLALIAALVLAVIAACILLPGHLDDLISFKTIGLNYEAMRHRVDANFPLAMLCYVAAYGLIGMFLLPGSPIITVASGLLFGPMLGVPLAVAGSTLAAVLGFTTARLTIGRSIGKLSTPLLDTLRAGFARHALSYMMFLRLTPGLPFGVVNVTPALLGVSLSTFAVGTAVGLLPSRIALSTAGAGLASAIGKQNVLYSQCLAANPAGSTACAYDIHVASLLTKETLAAFVALAVLALVPALLDAAPRVVERLRSKRNADV